MNDNEYREGENGFSGQPEEPQYPYGQSQGDTPYPYGQNQGNGPYPFGQQPGNAQYPYGQQPGNAQYPYGQQTGTPQYPYGQQPGNPQYPYGQGRGNGSPYPYGGQGYPPYGDPYGYAARPPKKSFGQRLREAFADPARRELMLLGMAAGAAILLLLLLSNIFSSVIAGNREIYDRYMNDEAFSLLLETMYTIFCTTLPFALIFGVVHKLGVARTELSFGRPRGGWQTALLLPAGLGLCFIGNLLSNYIVTFAGSFGVTFRSYEYTLEHQTDAPETAGLMLLTIVHTAVLPALLEELTFRGFLMQPLRKYGDWFAIITSALIFGLVHGNMTQVPFAILAGLALGYVNVISGSMWMNILLHFLNNLISVLYSFALTSAGENSMIVLSLIVTYGTIAIGVAAFIGYILTNRNFMRLRPGTAPRFEKKAAHYWLMPTMVIALLLMVQQIAMDVVIK